MRYKKALEPRKKSRKQQEQRFQMKLKNMKSKGFNTCEIPRRHQAIQALILLSWKKSKKDRPSWLIKEVDKYCQSSHLFEQSF